MQLQLPSGHIGSARLQVCGTTTGGCFRSSQAGGGGVPGFVVGLAVQRMSAAISALTLAAMPNIAVKVAPFGRWTRRTRRAPYL